MKRLLVLTALIQTLGLGCAYSLRSRFTDSGGRSIGPRSPLHHPYLRLMSVAVYLAVSPMFAQQQPIIARNYPIQDRGNISPPIVQAPIHECARAVMVSGFIPKATVRVYANGSELVGMATPQHSSATITLTRALVLGDIVTAQQIVNSIPSYPSYDPVTVTAYPALTNPVVTPEIYQCGRVVPVANLVASTHVEVKDLDAIPAALIGTGETTGDWYPIITSKLIANHRLIARQIACADMAAKTVNSPVSAPVRVKAAPDPPPAVTLDTPVVGADQVVLHNLVVGSQVQLDYGGTTVGGGLATASDNTANVPPIPPGVSITGAQILCSSSPSSPPVTATTAVPTPTLGSPICEGSHYVLIDNTIPDANVVLLRSGTVIGYGGGVLGTLKLAVGIGVTLSDGDVLTALQYVSSSYGRFFSDPSSEVWVGCNQSGNVVTQHNDNQRTGVNPAETTLTPAAVLARGMQVQYTHPVDGAINAQPLYVRRVEFDRGGANGLFIATSSNKVYALDADTGDEKWIATLIDSDRQRRGLPLGIDGTPVIDFPNHHIYVLFGTKNQKLDSADLPNSKNPLNDGKAHTYQDTDMKNFDSAFWIVTLDYRTGKELNRTQVSASAYRANGSTVIFDARFQRQHVSLLLNQGILYVAFGAIAGSEIFLEYHGWVMAYRASNLSFIASFCTSPNYAPPRFPYRDNDPEDGSGIWQGGGGLSADRDGNVFFLAGNGTADLTNNKYGDSFVKLTPTGSLLIPSAFVPGDAPAMEQNDADFGAGGSLAIPATDFVFGGGKPGYMYLVNRNTMALQQQITASTNQYDGSKRDDTWNMGPHLHGSPTYWRGPSAIYGYLYVWGEKDFARIYRFNTTTGKIEEPTFAQGKVKALDGPATAVVMPGGIMSISSDGNKTGTGILWATLPAASSPIPYPGRLYAFNAENLQPLWDIGFPSLGHWLVPTIADGKVFLGTSSGSLIVYQLGSEKSTGNASWNPYQPQELITLRPMEQAHWDESVMTTLPQATLLALTPPSGSTKFVVIDGQGTITYMAAGNVANRNAPWKVGESSIVGALTVGNDPFSLQSIRITVSPNLEWMASDGSHAQARLLKTYVAPEEDGINWALYAITQTSGHGIFTGVTYVQRVFTRGGLPPSAGPHLKAASTRVPFLAEYILYRKDPTDQNSNLPDR